MTEQRLDLCRVSQVHLQVQVLREHQLAVVPHLVQLVPAVLQRVQALAQEHVLRIGLVLRQVAAVLHHVVVVVRVVVDLVLDLVVFHQECLGHLQRVRYVLAGHLDLRLAQPVLEVVEVLEETMQIADLVQLLGLLLQLLHQLLPLLVDLLAALLDERHLLRMLDLDLVRLAVQHFQFRFDRLHVALHAAQTTLQRHDARQVAVQTFGGRKQFDLLLDPGHGLGAFDVERLNAVRTLHLLLLGHCLRLQVLPLVVQIDLAFANLR